MKGVYKIVNRITSDLYVGSTYDLEARRWRHFDDLKKNKHHSRYLQRAYLKYGSVNFEFVLLEEVKSSDDLLIREQYFLDLLKPVYNSSKIAGSCRGVKHTPEAIRKNSLSNSGYKNGNSKLKKGDDESIAKKRRQGVSVIELSIEYGVSPDAIWRSLRRQKVNIPRSPVSVETKLKLSIARKGQPGPGRKKVVLTDLTKNNFTTFDSITSAAHLMKMGVPEVSKHLRRGSIYKKRFVFTYYTPTL